MTGALARARTRARATRRRVVRRVRYDTFEIPADAPPRWGAPGDLEIRPATSGDVEAILARPLPGYVRATLRRTLVEPHGPNGLRLGQSGYVAIAPDGWVGATWVSEVSLRLSHLAIAVRLAPDEVYSYGTFILPDARAAGPAARALFARVLADAHDRGASRVICHVDTANRVSVAMRRLGRARESSLALVLLGRWYVTLRRTPRPAV
jgi:GNAT superfamily N-acetyltransferase